MKCYRKEITNLKSNLKKTGYALSYISPIDKKTILNFVNRKKGTLIRIYGNHADAYMNKIMTLPQPMIEEIKKGGECKRMIDKDACNSKCQMGVNLMIDGQVHSKCRYSALFFLVDPVNYTEIIDLIKEEMLARE